MSKNVFTKEKTALGQVGDCYNFTHFFFLLSVVPFENLQVDDFDKLVITPEDLLGEQRLEKVITHCWLPLSVKLTPLRKLGDRQESVEM